MLVGSEIEADQFRLDDGADPTLEPAVRRIPGGHERNHHDVNADERSDVPRNADPPRAAKGHPDRGRQPDRRRKGMHRDSPSSALRSEYREYASFDVSQHQRSPAARIFTRSRTRTR